MKQLLFTSLLCVLLFSCAHDKAADDYTGKWIEVKKVDNDFVIINCGDRGESLTVYNDSVVANGVMEDFTMPVEHIAIAADKTLLYNNKAERTFYAFTWVNKQKGIAKWSYVQEGLPAMVKFYVNNNNLKNIKTVKGTSADCITEEDTEEEEVEDIYKPDFTTKDGKTAIKLIRENCLELIDVKSDTTLMDKCFSDVMLQIRPLNSNALPLTFISGKHYMDVNFIYINNEWVANEVILFDPVNGSQTGVTKPVTVTLKDFDYSNVLEQTE